MTELLQDLIDGILESSLQQWLLRAIILLTPVAAALASYGAAPTGEASGLVVLVAVMAATATAIPDSQLPTIVIALVVWQWLARVDSVSSVWLPVAVTCLVLHHAAAALASTIPTGGVLPSAVLRAWAWRIAACSGLTVFVWIVATALERREADGNGLLTGAALVVAAGFASLIRSRSVGRSPIS